MSERSYHAATSHSCLDFGFIYKFEVQLGRRCGIKLQTFLTTARLSSDAQTDVQTYTQTKRKTETIIIDNIDVCIKSRYNDLEWHAIK